MEISYRHAVLDTEKHTRISYTESGTLDDFADHVIREAGREGNLPEMVGFVAARYPLLSNLSVVENVVLPLEYHRHRKTAEAVRELLPVIERLGMEAFLRKRKERLDGTGTIKAMFLRAVCLRPRVVCFLAPHQIAPLREFAKMIPLLREIAGGEMRFWIVLSEGLGMSWEHEAEVALDL